MAELHDALKSLGPAKWTDVPSGVEELKPYLTELLVNTQLIIDSVPLPPPSDAPLQPQAQPPNSATKASEVSLSSERPPKPPFDHERFQKEWGKPMKIKPQENPLGLSVYKMSGKDSKGAWFARRSIHEGIGFSKFKRSLQEEFEKSLSEPGPPGTGNVRGIGGEERVEQIKTDKAKVEVYRLSAQFPGPTAARDFVTLLITSDTALQVENQSKDGPPARHYMVVSKPCDHPDTQPRTGFVRGFYESIEFIREVPRKLKATQSSIDLGSTETARSLSAAQARNRAATVNDKGSSTPDLSHDDGSEDNPVEWIMVTRSDPGGGIPRFLVERGTPSSICGDAVKFLDWACQNTDEDIFEATTPIGHKPQRRESHQSWKGKGLAGINEHETNQIAGPVDEPDASVVPDQEQSSQPQNGLFGTVVGAAANLKTYTPQVILDRLPGAATSAEPQSSQVNMSKTATEDSVRGIHADNKSIVSTTSFASAEDHWSSSSEDEGEESSLDSRLSANVVPGSPDNVQREKELRRLDDKKQALNKKFAATRAKYDQAKAKQAETDAQTEAKYVEKHDREMKKHEEKYKKELVKIEKKQEKERKKAHERKKKYADKDEKTRLTRERDEARQELALAKKEAESLKGIVQDLQKQNTALVIKLGKLGSTSAVDIVDGGSRSRGSSLSRKEK